MVIIWALAQTPTKADSSWQLSSVLTPPDGEKGDRFGASVALSGDGRWLITGAPKHPEGFQAPARGTAYVWHRDGIAASWYLHQNLTGTLISASDNSGYGWTSALSQDGSIAFITGRNAVSTAGRIWAFRRGVEGYLNQTGLIYASTTRALNQFGVSMSVTPDGMFLAAGAPGYNSNLGAAYVCAGTPVGLFNMTFNCSDPIEVDGLTNVALFGTSVALSSDALSLIVGVPGNNSNYGGAYAFSRADTQQSFGAPQLLYPTCVPEQPYDRTRYGYSVAISGDGSVAAVASNPISYIRGFATVYARTMMSSKGSEAVWSDWVCQAGLYSSNYTDRDRFGASIAMSRSGSAILVGAPEEQWGFVFEKPSWSQTAMIVSLPRTIAVAEFGSSASVDDDGVTLAIGSPGEVSTTYVGWSYVYQRPASATPSPSVSPSFVPRISASSTASGSASGSCTATASASSSGSASPSAISVPSSASTASTTTATGTATTTMSSSNSPQASADNNAAYVPPAVDPIVASVLSIFGIVAAAVAASCMLQRRAHRRKLNSVPAPALVVDQGTHAVSNTAGAGAMPQRSVYVEGLYRYASPLVGMPITDGFSAAMARPTSTPGSGRG